MSTFFQPSIPHILFYVITILWNLEFVIFPSKFKSNDFSESKSFKQILFIIVLTITLTIGLTFFNLLRLPGAFHQSFYWIGIIFYALGLILRYSGTYYLGQYFTRNVEVAKDQKLVSNGPYKKLRHPLYLGLYILTISVPLFFAQWGMFVMAVLLMGHILNKRMRIEEQGMEKVLGNTYVEWKKKRYRFIPWIY